MENHNWEGGVVDKWVECSKGGFDDWLRGGGGGSGHPSKTWEGVQNTDRADGLSSNPGANYNSNNFAMPLGYIVG